MRALIASLLLASIGPSAVAEPLSPSPTAADAAAFFHYGVVGGPPTFALQVTTPPSLGPGVIRKGETIVSLDVRHARVGRLLDPVAADWLRLSPGTLMFAVPFRTPGRDSEALEAFCGVGTGGVFKVPATICVLPTADGKARVANGTVTNYGEDNTKPLPFTAYHFAPGWYVQAIRKDTLSAPVERPRIEVVDASALPSLQLNLVYNSQYKNKLYLRSYLAPTGGGATKQLVRFYDDLLLQDGVVRFPFGGFDLVLTPVADGVEAKWSKRAGADNGAAPTAHVTSEVTSTPPAQGRFSTTPFVLAGALIDPASLKATPGKVAEGGTLVEGSARHWGTARAEVDVSVLGLHVRTPKDAVFHKVESLTQDSLGARTLRRAWCGPMRGVGLTTIRCLPIRSNGGVDGEYFFADGKEWMAVLPRTSGTTAAVDTMKVTPSESDLIGPMKFALKLAGIGAKLSLQADVERNGETVTVWRGTLPFDGQRSVQVPLWTKTLVARRSGDSVEVVLENGGDGTGPAEADILKER